MKQPFQIDKTRSISACAPAQILKLGWRAFKFIGSAERKLAKPECISPEIARQCARAARSLGKSPAFGFISATYSAIASVSHTDVPSCSRHGTRKDGDSKSSSARVEGSFDDKTRSSKSRPAILQRSQPRSDHDE